MLGLFNAGQHDRSSGPARWPPTRPAARRSAPRRTAPAPRRASRSLARHDQQGASTCSTRRPGRQRRASSCRSRAPRSTSRTTPPNPCGQIGETVAFDQAIQVALRLRARRTRTRWSSSPPTTATPARSSRPSDDTHPRRAEHPDHHGRRADVTSTTPPRPPASRSSTPAPRCGSPPRARRRPTSSGSSTRPTCSTSCAGRSAYDGAPAPVIREGSGLPSRAPLMSRGAPGAGEAGA